MLNYLHDDNNITYLTKPRGGLKDEKISIL